MGGVAVLVGYMFHIGMIATPPSSQEEHEEGQEEEGEEEGSEAVYDAGSAVDFLNVGNIGGGLGIPSSS